MSRVFKLGDFLPPY